MSCINVAGTSDFSLAHKDLIFPDSSAENATQCISILTADDTESEGDETFSVILTTQDYENIMLGNNVTTVTIIGKLSSLWKPLTSNCTTNLLATFKASQKCKVGVL